MNASGFEVSEDDSDCPSHHSEEAGSVCGICSRSACVCGESDLSSEGHSSEHDDEGGNQEASLQCQTWSEQQLVVHMMQYVEKLKQLSSRHEQRDLIFRALEDARPRATDELYAYAASTLTSMIDSDA